MAAGVTSAVSFLGRGCVLEDDGPIALALTPAFGGPGVPAAGLALVRVCLGVAGTGGTGGTGARAFERDAAVGLLRRSDELAGSAVFFADVVVDAEVALRDFAREAAVGAKSPEDGVFGRIAGDDAVAVTGRTGVLGLTVLVGLTTNFLVDPVEAVDMPVWWGLRGCIAGAPIDCLGARVVDLGEVFIVNDLAFVCVRDGVVGDACSDEGCATGTSASSLRSSSVDGIGSMFNGSTNGAGSGSDIIGGISGWGADCDVGKTKEVRGRTGELSTDAILSPMDFGGHSRFSLISWLADSPV